MPLSKNVKSTIKLILPPIFLTLINKFIRKNNSYQPIFNGVYTNSNDVVDQQPWDKPRVLDLQRDKLDRLKERCHDVRNGIPALNDAESIPFFIMNMISFDRKCTVYDIGGGTGHTYLKIFPYIKNPQNIDYHVIDNVKLAGLGIEYLDIYQDKIRIIFHEEFPETEGSRIDVVLLSSSLQYIYEYKDFLEKIANLSPSYVIITYLPSGDFETYITEENHHGFSTPRVLFNTTEIIDIFKNKEYKLIYSAPLANEFLPESYYDRVPVDLMVKTTRNMVFRLSISS